MAEVIVGKMPKSEKKGTVYRGDIPGVNKMTLSPICLNVVLKSGRASHLLADRYVRVFNVE